MSIKELYGKKRDEGFTIIEVMIVLAIVGLIILIVFLAVPALQRNSRNTQRKSDASHLSGLINEYVANHNGTLPSSIGAGGTNQLDTTNEHFAIMNIPATTNDCSSTCTGTALGDLNNLKVDVGATCNNGVPTPGGGSRAFTVSFQLEKAAGGTTGDQQCI